jgi:hypothetical protein
MSEPLEWRVDLGQGRTKQRNVVAIIILAVVAVGTLIFQNPFFGIIGGLMIFGATAELFMPIKYRLNDEGVRRQIGLSVSFLPWSQVRRVVQDEAGILLTSLPTPSRLDAFRGIRVLWSSNREHVLGKINVHLHDHAGELVGRVDPGGNGSTD